MAKANFKSVEEYIALQPEAVQGMLQRVRNAIRAAVPGIEEGISYNIPTYKLKGEPVLHFAGWKEHYSLYPASDPVIALVQDHLERCEVDKRTIRFPFSQPVPVKLIERIAKVRAKEVSR